MLEDRSYMRPASFRSGRSATVTLLIVLAVCYVAQLALERWSNFPVNRYLALSLQGLKQGYVWQLISFQFLHGGWLHLLLNCWVIYVFGREVEETIGKARFCALYFSSGILGGVLQTLFGLVLDSYFAAPVLGASAGAFGLVAAFAAMNPDRVITLLLFFIIPVSLRAKMLLLFAAILAVLGIVFPTDNVAHAAHLGGMLTGLAFIRFVVRDGWHWPKLRLPFPRPKGRPLIKVTAGKGSLWGRGHTIDVDDLPPDEFLSQEVDPILDKISAHGIQSLTERERRILEQARKKMAKR